MTAERLDQIISQTRLSIERDEAEAKQRLAAAAEKRQLLTVLEQLNRELQEAKDDNARKEERIRQLEQRIEDLQQNGISYNVNGNYIETLRVETRKPVLKNKRTNAKTIDLAKQLDLWTNPALSM